MAAQFRFVFWLNRPLSCIGNMIACGLLVACVGCGDSATPTPDAKSTQGALADDVGESMGVDPVDRAVEVDANDLEPDAGSPNVDPSLRWTVDDAIDGHNDLTRALDEVPIESEGVPFDSKLFENGGVLDGSAPLLGDEEFGDEEDQTDLGNPNDI